MIHDEKTTEIEIPPKAQVVPFRRRASDRKDNAQAKPASPAPASQASATAAIPSERFPIDFTSPWTLRLLAVLVILALSLLVI